MGSEMCIRDSYGEYKQLHDYFGRGGSNVMKRLKALSREQKQKEQNFQP